MEAVGDDGLTDSERAEYARRWEEGQGAMPSKEISLRALRHLNYLNASNDLAQAVRDAGGDPDATPQCSCGRFVCRRALRHEKGHVMPL